jgi:hypothetical protein
MKKMILVMSVLALMAGMTSCKNADMQNVLNAEKQESNLAVNNERTSSGISKVQTVVSKTVNHP